MFCKMKGFVTKHTNVELNYTNPVINYNIPICKFYISMNINQYIYFYCEGKE